MTESTPIDSDENVDSEIDGNALGERVRDFETDDKIEFYIDSDVGLVRVQGVVTETHSFPGIPGSEISDWERQFSLNLDDDSYEGVGDIRGWGIATQLSDGKLSQPTATAWLQEEDELIELFPQPVVSIK